MSTAYDPWQFAARRKFPVSVHQEGAEGTIVSNGISFEDYSFMSTVSRNKPFDRRRPVPAFAQDPKLMRQCVLLVCERRLNLNPPKGATDAERLAAIDKAAKEGIPRLIAIVDELSRTYVREKQENPDSPRLKGLETQIQSYDTLARMHQHGLAGIITSVLYYWFNCHQDSVEVSMSLNNFIRPVTVRQIITRACSVQKRMSRTCRECGATFYVRGRRHRYCSDRCYRQVHARQRREWRARRKAAVLLGMAMLGLCPQCKERKLRERVNFVAQFSSK